MTQYRPRKPPSPWPWINRERERQHNLPYRSRSKFMVLYTEVPPDVIPENVRWSPRPGVRPDSSMTVLYSPGGFYRLVRMRETGTLTYYKAKDMGPEVSPPEKIDAEPEPEKHIQYRSGCLCWFVDVGSRWFLCKVEERPYRRIVLSSVTGWDADRRCPWPYTDLLEFPSGAGNPMFRRLRPLKARYQ